MFTPDRVSLSVVYPCSLSLYCKLPVPAVKCFKLPQVTSSVPFSLFNHASVPAAYPPFLFFSYTSSLFSLCLIMPSCQPPTLPSFLFEGNTSICLPTTLYPFCLSLFFRKSSRPRLEPFDSVTSQSVLDRPCEQPIRLSKPVPHPDRLDPYNQAVNATYILVPKLCREEKLYIFVARSKKRGT